MPWVLCIHDTVSRRIASTHPNTTELVVGDENFRLTGLQVVTATASVGGGAGVVMVFRASSNAISFRPFNLNVGVDLAACMKRKRLEL